MTNRYRDGWREARYSSNASHMTPRLSQTPNAPKHILAKVYAPLNT